MTKRYVSSLVGQVTSFLVVSTFDNEVKTHIRHEEARGWIPTKTGIMLTPSEIKELAQFLPQFGQAYFLLEERLREDDGGRS